MPKVSKEHQILFQTLKGDQFLLNEDINPDRLFSLYQRHRLFPLASEIVNLLDEENKQKWKNAIQALTLRSLHQTSVLSNAIKGFENQRMNAIPLKGPVLAHYLYGNIGDRHSVDLDILIRGEEIKRIIEIAEGLGYSLRFPKSGLTAKQWNYYFRYKNDIGLINKDKGVFIELHTGIHYHELLKNSEEDLLWEDLSRQEVGGKIYHCMNHENTFLYLTFHGGLHQYFRLFWLRDVAEALQRWKLDHQKILMNAKSLGIERLLGVSLELATEYFNTQIPSEYQSYLKEDYKIIKRLKRFCMKRIQDPENLSFKDKIQRHFYIFLLKSGMRYKSAVIGSSIHRWYIGRFLEGH